MRDKTGTEYRRVSRAFYQHPTAMKMQEGKMGYLLLWLVGVPIPILLIIFSAGMQLTIDRRPLLYRSSEAVPGD